MDSLCIVCDSPDVSVVYEGYPGYVEGTSFDIYECSNCGCHFVIAEEDTSALYELVYSAGKSQSYGRYFQYAESIKSKKDPLRFLALTESVYYPVYRFVSTKTELRILEVGCGYGYLGHALRARGFDVFGLDISSKAIEYARKNFGDQYAKADFLGDTALPSESFDAVIATEVIEHLKNPRLFLERCVGVLKPGGSIILTTPNRDYGGKGAVWQTDLPPVHISWMGQKTMRELASRYHLEVQFTDFSNYYPRLQNRLVKYLRSRQEKIGRSALTKEYLPNRLGNYGEESILHRSVSFLLHKTFPVRQLSNFLYNRINGIDITLGIVFTKT